jgi:hypothetical protein
MVAQASGLLPGYRTTWLAALDRLTTFENPSRAGTGTRPYRLEPGGRDD